VGIATKVMPCVSSVLVLSSSCSGANMRKNVSAPLPYRHRIIRKPKGVKNSAGGAEPDNRSPIAGASRKRTSAGGNSGFFIGGYHSCVNVYVPWLARHHFSVL